MRDHASLANLLPPTRMPLAPASMEGMLTSAITVSPRSVSG